MKAPKEIKAIAQMDRAVRDCIDQLTASLERRLAASMEQRVRIDPGKEGDE